MQPINHYFSTMSQALGIFFSFLDPLSGCYIWDPLTTPSTAASSSSEHLFCSAKPNCGPHFGLAFTLLFISFFSSLKVPVGVIPIAVISDWSLRGFNKGDHMDGQRSRIDASFKAKSLFLNTFQRFLFPCDGFGKGCDRFSLLTLGSFPAKEKDPCSYLESIFDWIFPPKYFTTKDFGKESAWWGSSGAKCVRLNN